MKHFLTAILILFFHTSAAQIQFVGFDRATCPQPLQNSYTYTNFSNGTGSGSITGYTIYKNGMPVFSDSGSMGSGKQCRDLMFIDDSTGFLVYFSGNTSNRVLRTEDYGQSWADVGGGAPTYFGLYIVNTNFAYLVTQWNFPMQLYVARCSNLQAFVNPWFINDNLINSDLYRTDSILNTDLCNIDSLRIYIFNGTDTITYYINFYTLNVGLPSLPEVETTLTVFPNPSNECFSFSEITGVVESVSLISGPGAIVMEYDASNFGNNYYPIPGIPGGMYLLRITVSGETHYRKLLVSGNR